MTATDARGERPARPDQDGMGAVRPVRLQLSRKKGFDLQAHSRAANGLPAVNCARPGLFGNPWPVSEAQQFIDDGARELGEYGSPQEIVVGWYEGWISGSSAQGKYLPPTQAMIRDRLSAGNLACWCRLCPAHAAIGKPLDTDCPDCAPCHVNVLGRIVCDTPTPDEPTGASSSLITED